MFTRFLTVAILALTLVGCGSDDPAPVAKKTPPKKEVPKKEVPKKTPTQTPTQTPTKTPPKTEAPACDTDMSDLQKRAQTVAEDYALTKAETLRFKIILAKSFKKAPTSCEDFQDLEMAISDFNTLLGGSLEVCAIIAPSDASIVDGNPAVSPSGDCSIDFIQFDIVSLEKELAPLNKELEDRRDKKVSDAIKAKEFAKAVEAAAPLVKELVAFNKANDFSSTKAVIANNGKIRPAVTKMIEWLTLRTGREFTIGSNLGLQFRGIAI